MLDAILSECISIIGTLISILFIRYLMELSTPAEDLFTIERFFIRVVHRWEMGNFQNLVIWFRVKRLLDYE